MITPTSSRSKLEITPASDPNPTSTNWLNRTVSSYSIYAPSRLTAALGLLTLASASTSIALSIVGIDCLQGGNSYPLTCQNTPLTTCSIDQTAGLRRLNILDCNPSQKFFTPQQEGSNLLIEAVGFGLCSTSGLGFTLGSYAQDIKKAKEQLLRHTQNEV